jgi:hypothetical protein
VLLKRLDGCTLDQIETSRDTKEGPDRKFSSSGRYDTSFGRLVLWADGCPDGMTRRPDSWQGTEFSALQTV